MKSRQQVSPFGMEIKIALIRKQKSWPVGLAERSPRCQMLCTVGTSVRKQSNLFGRN